MGLKIIVKAILFIFASTCLFSCLHQNAAKMNEAQTSQLIKDVKRIYDRLTEHAENAQVDSFLAYYDNSPTFLHISSDGKMRNYDEFKKICAEYYDSLQSQKISTSFEKFNVVDTSLIILGWTGDIVAKFKNGSIMYMNNYSITSILRKVDGSWKIVHSHESALPPKIVKNGL